MANKTKQAVELLKKALALLAGSGDEAEAPKVPSVKEINALEPEELADLASKLGIKAKKPKLLLILASQIVAGEADDASEEELAALCKATGVSEGDDTEETIKALSEFFASGTSAEGGDSDDDADEKPAKKAKKVVSDDDDDDGEEVPVKKKKVVADDDDEDGEDEAPKKKKKPSDDDDDDSGDDDEPKKKSDDDDDDDDAEEPPKAAKWLAAHNKVAKKPAKNWAALKELLTDDEGNVAAWGAAYVKGENAWCCGIKCKDVQLDGEEVAKCLVTGKMFKPTDAGELEEVTED